MSVTGAITNLSQTSTKLSKLKKSIGWGGALTAGFCIFDFLTVPGAFNLKYNTDAEKVEGTNWKSGFKELGKSTIKCLSYIAAPVAITGAAALLGPIGLSLGAIAGFGSTFALSSIFDKLLPEEQKLVAEACKKKGIDINEGKKEYVA